MKNKRLEVWVCLCGMSALIIQLASCAVPQVVVQEVPESTEEVLSVVPTSISDPDGFFTRAQASRGERRFDQLCADCHRGVEIRRIWFGGQRHQSVNSLYEVISTTMPDGNPGGLNSDQYTDIVAFLLSLNGYSEGQNELHSDQEILEGIRIPLP